MSNQIVPVNVHIFGKEYPVACPPGQEDGLRKSAIRVDEEMRKIRESGKVVGTDRIAVMVALNLAHELLLANGADALMPVGDTDTASQQRISQIQQDIDAALERFQDK
ncbi:MAG: cell division protein ZapA [Thiolinea sp.]